MTFIPILVPVVKIISKLFFGKLICFVTMTVGQEFPCYVNVDKYVGRRHNGCDAARRTSLLVFMCVCVFACVYVCLEELLEKSGTSRPLECVFPLHTKFPLGTFSPFLTLLRVFSVHPLLFAVSPL